MFVFQECCIGAGIRNTADCKEYEKSARAITMEMSQRKKENDRRNENARIRKSLNGHRKTLKTLKGQTKNQNEQRYSESHTDHALPTTSMFRIMDRPGSERIIENPLSANKFISVVEQKRKSKNGIEQTLSISIIPDRKESQENKEDKETDIRNSEYKPLSSIIGSAKRLTDISFKRTESKGDALEDSDRISQVLEKQSQVFLSHLIERGDSGAHPSEAKSYFFQQKQKKLKNLKL